MGDGRVIEWLLEGDPAIRWQAMRDLVGASEKAVARERRKIATEGWGAKLLSYQDSSGRWGGELYNNKWLSTTYSMLLLRQMGLEPTNHQAHLACKELLEGGFQEDGGISYAKTIDCIDSGVTGMILSLLAYFGHQDDRVHAVAEYLVGQQMPDGRWEPVPDNKQIRYTFDSTMLILEGLREYQERFPERARPVVDAQSRDREFLLRHWLHKEAGRSPRGSDSRARAAGVRTYEPCRSRSANQAIVKKMTLFSFPPRWHYDVLVALDYSQDCKAPRDERLNKAIDLLRSKQGRDGTW